MKLDRVKVSMVALVIVLFTPAALLAQDDKGDKGDKDKKDKEMQQIIITRKSDKDEKVVIEVKGDKVTVNGKEVKNDDRNGDVSVRVNQWKDPEALLNRISRKTWTGDGNNFDYFTVDDNRALLGISTRKVDNGVEVQSVTKESGAEKAGLKEKDIITKIDDKKVEEPDDIVEIVQKHKPGEKISITYLRDNKEQKTTAELTKWKGIGSWTIAGDKKMFEMGDMNFDRMMPKVRTMPFSYNWMGGNPKLGLSVQDNEDGKGVKVIDVDEESNAAKAGIKEDDVITEADGKTINNADDIVKVIRESKDKVSITLKVQRAGKSQNIEVKMPRKLKTAEL